MVAATSSQNLHMAGLLAAVSRSVWKQFHRGLLLGYAGTLHFAQFIQRGAVAAGAKIDIFTEVDRPADVMNDLYDDCCAKGGFVSGDVIVAISGCTIDYEKAKQGQRQSYTGDKYPWSGTYLVLVNHSFAEEKTDFSEGWPFNARCTLVSVPIKRANLSITVYKDSTTLVWTEFAMIGLKSAVFNTSDCRYWLLKSMHEQAEEGRNEIVLWA
ncbi:hypothetical protein SAMN02745866_01333 [Alteromonadaceae bacterium Bs31]|nr:hypothetical protein SAMN02745866_01333 [Alteromonadaceae bacterium Bs31]